MRTAFVRTLVDMAAVDPRIMLLTGDLGFMALEPFADRFPDRFMNVGVAEQNMVGLATGLAEAGLVPFVYSIVTFAALRPYEFIRNGPIAHQFPVRIVGMGGGFDYGTAGPTHYGLDDIGVMRIQPGITVVAPADSAQAATALLETKDVAGPVYYRLGKNDAASVPGLRGRFKIGRAQTVRQGSDFLIVAMGAVAEEAAAAAELLAEQGVECEVLIVASVSPAPVEDLTQALARFSTAITVEAHYLRGGLGSLVSDVVAEQGSGCRLVKCAVRDLLDPRCGSQEYMHRVHGLDRRSIAETVLYEAGVRPAMSA